MDSEIATQVLSMECAGSKNLKSFFSKYLEVLDDQTNLDWTTKKPECNYWAIEDWGGKVAFKSVGLRVGYLTAQADDRVILTFSSKLFESWTPVRNQDGTLSFKSVNGTWLSSDRNQGFVKCSLFPGLLESFWLEDCGNQTKTIVEPSRKCEDIDFSCTGQRTIRSTHSTYLSFDKSKISTNEKTEGSQRWYIQEWHGKVILKSFCSPDSFLSGHHDGSVNLSYLSQDEEMWTPIKHQDHCWSFQSVHGKWLSVCNNGLVTSVDDCGSGERFWLGQWN